MCRSSAACVLNSIVIVLIALISAPTLAINFDRYQYDVYIGDHNLDGIDDVYLSARDSIIPIHGTIVIPLPVQLANNYIIESTNSGFYEDPREILDSEINIESLLLVSDAVVHDFNEDGHLDIRVSQQGSLISEIIALGSNDESRPAVVSNNIQNTIIAVPNFGSNLTDSQNSTFTVNFDFDTTVSVGVEQEWTLRSYDITGSLQSIETIWPSEKSFTVNQSGVYRYELWLYECYEDPFDSRFDTCGGDETPILYDTYYARVALKPGVPESINLFSVEDGSVDRNGEFIVTWGPARSAAPFISPPIGYEVQQEFNSNGQWNTIYSQANIQNRTISVPVSSELNSGSYRYRVRTYNNTAGLLNYSNWITSNSITVNTKPDAVTIFSQPGASVQSSSFPVAWESVSGGFPQVSNYELQCSINGSNFTYNTCGSSNLGTANIYNVILPNGSQGEYRFRARACNVAGCGPWTPSSSYRVVSVNIPLPPPSNVRFTSIPESSDFGDYDISWTADGTVTSYELSVECKSGLESCGNEGFNSLNLQSPLSESYQARGQTQDKYRYQVRACNGTFCSGWVTSSYIDVHNLEGITPAVSLSAATTPGRINYVADVTAQGDALVSIPFQVIPGVNNLEPNIGLVYSMSRRRDRINESLPEDILGYGWRLSGLSEIRRCVTNQPNGTLIELNLADQLCLNGEPLVKVNTASRNSFPGARTDLLTHGSVYRKLRDDGTLITFNLLDPIRNSVSVGKFEVRRPDGTVETYGHIRSSGNQSTVRVSGAPVFSWLISRVTDPFGNTINYRYHADTVQGINYPLEITYGENDDTRIEFQYGTRTDAPPQPLMEGEIEQSQLVLLHTVNFYLNNTKVREYRLISEEAPDIAGVDHFRRLNQVQLCGYDELGNNRECLNPISIDWEEPGSGNDMDILTAVSKITDGLGAVTQFNYVLIDDNSSSGLFSERPFGEGILPPDVSDMQPIEGIYRCVVDEVWRSNGVASQWHKVKYSYQGKGLVSDKNWGFLGYYAQKEHDLETDIVTYRQYRMDFPHFASVARSIQTQGEFGLHSQILSESQAQYQSLTFELESDDIIHYPYVAQSSESIYESNQQLGFNLVTSSFEKEYTEFGEVLSSGTRISRNVTTGVLPTTQSFWGEVKNASYSEVSRSNVQSVAYLNRTSPWLIGFGSVEQETHYSGDIFSVAERTQALNSTPFGNTLRPSTVINMPGDNQHELTVSFDYDLQGNLISQSTSGVGFETRTTQWSNYIASRYPGQITNALSQVTDVEYDLRFGTADYVSDVNDRITTTNYDAFGRVISVTDPDLVTSTVSYNFCQSGTCPVTGQIPASYSVTTDSPITPVNTSYFDFLDRLVHVSSESFDGSKTINLEYNYDSLGRLFIESDPFFTGDVKPLYTHTFDIRNRLTQTVKPDSSIIRIEYNAIPGTNQIKVSTYESVIDETGTEQQQKDEYIHINGDVEQIVDAVGTDNEVNTQYSYDGTGLLKTVVVNDDLRTQTTLSYDSLGQRTSLLDPSFGIIENSYNALGELTSSFDNKGQITTYEYDRLGRVLRQVDADGIAEWAYDPAQAIGQIASSKYTLDGQENFYEEYSYNSDTYLSSVATRLTAGGLTRNYSTRYVYDSFGRLDNGTYPDGTKITYGYNTVGFNDSIIRNGVEIKRYTNVNARGQVENYLLGNGVAVNDQFDHQTGFFTSTRATSSSLTLLDANYIKRSNGSLKTKNSIVSSNQSSAIHEYDSLNRLVSYKDTYGTNGEETYTYDKLGNIIEKVSTFPNARNVTNYQYGENGASPYAVTSFNLDGINHNLEYDQNGAITHYDVAIGDDRWITWNARQLPTDVRVAADKNTANPTAKDQFLYGPDGQRFYRESQWLDESTGELMSEKAFILPGYEDRLPANDAIYNRVQRLTIDSNIEVVTTTTLLGIVEQEAEYIHRDNLGSVVRITDEQGNLLVDPSSEYDFAPFGERIKANLSGGLSEQENEELLSALNVRTRRGFTGHEHFDRTGFIHMNGRIYDPVIGRFLSPDPRTQAPEYSQNWNRYTYVFNDPATFTDPTGFDAEFNDDDGPSDGRITFGNGLFGFDDVAFNNGSGFGSGGTATAAVAQAQLLDAEAQNSITSSGPSDRQIAQINSVLFDRFADSAVAFTNNTVVRDIGSLILDSVPGVGTAKSIIEVFTGRDLVTGQEVSRITAAAGIVAGLVPGGKALLKGATSFFSRFGSQARKATSRVRMCFVAGTLIHTSEGLKAIEEVEVGDLVAAKETVDGEVQWKPVTQLFVNENKDVLNITFTSQQGESETIGTTPEHPFWVSGKGWTEAKNLVVSDIVTDKAGVELNVTSISKDPEKHTTYNFEVAEFHTYFVGEQGVWVHNMCPGDSDPGLNELVQALESRGIPVTNTNVNILNTNGNRLGEIDIVTPNAVIQLKTTSSAMAIIEQIEERTEPFVTRPVVGFVQDQGRAGRRAVNGAQRRGFLVTNDFETLVELIK